MAFPPSSFQQDGCNFRVWEASKFFYIFSCVLARCPGNDFSVSILSKKPLNLPWAAFFLSFCNFLLRNLGISRLHSLAVEVIVFVAAYCLSMVPDCSRQGLLSLNRRWLTFTPVPLQSRIRVVIVFPRTTFSSSQYSAVLSSCLLSISSLFLTLDRG